MENFDFNNEERVNSMLGSAYGQTSPLPEYKMRLLQDLKKAASAKVVRRPLWRMTDWAIIAAVIILMIIIYGIWLPQDMLTRLVP
ncbi:MAG: hypothetical protein MUO92_03335 [Dehalococcoidales bacterium]|nr:hypothetical protein [Dehalococcoidales bacterium]